MSKCSGSKPKSVVQSSIEASAETIQNDERFFDNTLSEGDSYEALKEVASGKLSSQYISDYPWYQFIFYVLS